jgi:hypothetical protein
MSHRSPVRRSQVVLAAALALQGFVGAPASLAQELPLSEGQRVRVRLYRPPAPQRPRRFTGTMGSLEGDTLRVRTGLDDLRVFSLAEIEKLEVSQGTHFTFMGVMLGTLSLGAAGMAAGMAIEKATTDPCIDYCGLYGGLIGLVVGGVAGGVVGGLLLRDERWEEIPLKELQLRARPGEVTLSIRVKGPL